MGDTAAIRFFRTGMPASGGDVRSSAVFRIPSIRSPVSIDDEEYPASLVKPGRETALADQSLSAVQAPTTGA